MAERNEVEKALARERKLIAQVVKREASGWNTYDRTGDAVVSACEMIVKRIMARGKRKR